MKIVISAEARQQVVELLDYPESNWSLMVKENFLEKLERSTEAIRILPKAFPASKRKKGQ